MHIRTKILTLVAMLYAGVIYGEGSTAKSFFDTPEYQEILVETATLEEVIDFYWETTQRNPLAREVVFPDFINGGMEDASYIEKADVVYKRKEYRRAYSFFMSEETRKVLGREQRRVVPYKKVVPFQDFKDTAAGKRVIAYLESQTYTPQDVIKAIIEGKWKEKCQSSWLRNSNCPEDIAALPFDEQVTWVWRYLRAKDGVRRFTAPSARSPKAKPLKNEQGKPAVVPYRIKR